jgi:hypothetical protein
MIAKSERSLSFVKVFISLVLMFGLVVASTGVAEIYRWVDDEGNVHFGDCPPTSCESEEVQLAPTPSHQVREEAQERFRRLQEYQKSLRENRNEVPSRIDKPVASPLPDVECFSPLVAGWDGEIPDAREEIERRPLKKNELQRFEDFFQALKGRWRGKMVDIQCIRPEATPPTKSYRYEVILDAQWEADQLFKIAADLENDEPEGDLRRQFFWMLLSRDGLRFNKSVAELSFELDRPRFDVEILTSGKKALVFFLRRGGPLRRTNVFSLHRTGRGFTISEFFYVQGTLAGKRLWTIER